MNIKQKVGLVVLTIVMVALMFGILVSLPPLEVHAATTQVDEGGTGILPCPPWIIRPPHNMYCRPARHR
jgi:hypothetical protein